MIIKSLINMVNACPNQWIVSRDLAYQKKEIIFKGRFDEYDINYNARKNENEKEIYLRVNGYNNDWSFSAILSTLRPAQVAFGNGNAIYFTQDRNPTTMNRLTRDFIYIEKSRLDEFQGFDRDEVFMRIKLLFP